MRIGIMGGTYNPIHIGHLILSQFAAENLSLDKVLFIPTGNPPHKQDVLSSICRKEMVELAIESNDLFQLCTLEIEKEGLSYTYETLEVLKKKYGDCELFLILGSDSLMTMHTWKNYDRIINMASIVVMDRRGYDKGEVDIRIEELRRTYGGNIKKVPCPIIEISSTKIRNRLAEDKTIKYLVPESVEKYILKNGLYKHGK